MSTLATTGFLGADGNLARREFLSYCLSLMRAHNGEHLDSLPILDVSALKHVAYVFDALIYYMRSGTNTEIIDSDNVREGMPLTPWNDQVDIAFILSIFNYSFTLNCRMRTKMKRVMKIYQ